MSRSDEAYYGPSELRTSDRMKDRTVLIVEDDALIALDLADIVRLSGFAVLGPFARADRAMRALETALPDAALIDFDLGSHTSAPVAERLAALDVPGVVLSGHPPSALPEAFAAFAYLSKPVLQSQVEALLEDFILRPAAE